MAARQQVFFSFLSSLKAHQLIYKNSILLPTRHVISLNILMKEILLLPERDLEHLIVLTESYFFSE